MTRQEMLEQIKLHHPHLGEKEIIIRINRAKDTFCEESELIEASLTIDGGTIANQTYYQLPSDILKIRDVWLDRVKIPRLIGKPPIDDVDTGTEG